MASDSMEGNVSTSSLMDLDTTWSDDDFTQEFSTVAHRSCKRLSMSGVDLDFKKFATKTATTSTPFVTRLPIRKSLVLSELPLPEWISNDSGYDTETSNMSLNDGHVNASITSTYELSSNFRDQIQPHKRRSIDSDGFPMLEPLSENDSAYDDASSVCSVQSQTPSDLASISPQSSCDSQIIDMGFQALDLNSSGYSSINSSRYCSQHNLAIDDDAVHMSAESESSSGSQDSVVEMVCIRLEQELPLYSKAVADRLIGRKMGLSTVDIVRELQRRNLMEPLHMIFNQLSVKDITSLCCVTKHWQNAVMDDSPTKLRKLQYVKHIREFREQRKENRSLKGSRAAHGLIRRRGPDPAPLVELVPSNHQIVKSTLLAVTQCKMGQFISAAETLISEQSLRKCPKCQHPARVHQIEERGKCTNSTCEADFCINCLGPFHGTKVCSGVITNNPVGATVTKKSRTNVKICSKKSKRNLRRL